MILRPNPETVFTKELYDKKADKWVKKWPKLKVIPWEEAKIEAPYSQALFSKRGWD